MHVVVINPTDGNDWTTDSCVDNGWVVDNSRGLMLDASSLAVKGAELAVNASSCWAFDKMEEAAYDEDQDEQEVVADCSLSMDKRKDCVCCLQR